MQIAYIRETETLYINFFKYLVELSIPLCLPLPAILYIRRCQQRRKKVKISYPLQINTCMYIHGEVITNKYCIIYGFLVLLNPRNNATFDNLVKSRSDLLESLEKIQCLSRHRTETVTQSLFCTLAEFFYVSSLTRVENVLSRLLLLPRCILCILARETNRSRLVAM